jgi:hypothetical protein
MMPKRTHTRDHDRRDRIIARTATVNTEQQRQHQAWLTTQNHPSKPQQPHDVSHQTG